MIRTLLSLLFAVSAFGALDGRSNTDWVSPIGIPFPTFGITNSHWQYHPDTGSGATWNYGSGAVEYRTNAFGPYVYYVDRTAAGATDTANTYGTPATPRLSWPDNLAAGAVVQVHGGGSYTFNNGPSSTMRFRGTGTSALPIYIVGVGDTTNVADRPKIDAKAALIQGEWVMVEGFIFTNMASLTTRNDLHAAPIKNIAVRSNIFWGTGAASSASACAQTSGSSDYYTDGFVIFNNFFHSYGNYTNSVENDGCSIIFRDYSTNCWALNNYCTQMGGDFIRVGSNQDNDLDNCFTGYHYVGRNIAHKNGENAVDVKKARYVVVSENEFYDFNQYVPSGGDSVISIHYNPNYVWFFNNYLHDGNQGVSTGSRMQTTNEMWWVGNVFWDMADSGSYWRGPAFTNTWLNNTLVDCVNGLRISTSGNGPQMRMSNNVFYSSSTFHITFPNSVARGNAQIGYDNYINSGGGALIDWSGTYTSVSSWIAAAPTGDNCLQVAPGFIDYSTQDFSLAPGSAMIGAGVSVDFATRFQDTFGFSLNYKDRAGNTRPLDGTWDLGAYEYGTTVDAGPKGYKQQQIIGVGVGL